MNDNTQRFIAKIEQRYGKYASDEDRHDIAAFLIRRYADHLETLGMVMTAIKENCETRWGAPEVAKIKEAIDKYQKDYGTRIEFKEPRRPAVTAEERNAIREETLIDIKKMARERGIDTSKDSYAANLFYALMAEQKAKEAEDTKGRVQE